MNTNVEKIKYTKVKNRDIKKDGFIRMVNKGAFVASAVVSYTLNGEFIEKTTRDLPVFQGDIIIIPAGATDIHFSVWIAVYFEEWKVIYNKTFNSIPTKCYNLYGKTFYAQCVEIPCDANNNPNPLPPVIIPPYNCGCPCRCCCNYCCNPQYYNPYISSNNSLGEGYGYNYY